MADVVVLGTVAVDVVLVVPAVPRAGDQTVATPAGWRIGGSSANVAVALAAAGHRVELIGPVGADAMADALLENLRQRGVRTHRCVRVDAPSPRALILIDADGERTIVQLDRGSAVEGFALTEPPDLGQVGCVYVESYERFPAVAFERPRSALLVATPPTAGRERWPADVLIGSERQYPPEWLPSPFTSGRAVAGPRLRWVIVTRGRHGADAYGEEGSCHVAARDARQVDATGAGDAFSAGVIHALLTGHDVREAMDLGAEGGAAAIERMQSVPSDWFEALGAT
jgi:sugar/nucleoside kinase (ribokinase family)